MSALRGRTRPPRRSAALDPARRVADKVAMKPNGTHFDRPAPIPAERFEDAELAVERLELIYDRHTAFIRERFSDLLKRKKLRGRVRATYPHIRVETTTYAKIDSRFSYGHVAGPGVYATTVTQPALFRNYLIEQIRLGQTKRYCLH